MERRTIYFSGNVQGVGFRYTTYRLATPYQVGGYVQNLTDGTVELVVEGEADELDRFLEQLEQTMSEHIRDTKTETRTGISPQFQTFEIRH